MNKSIFDPHLKNYLTLANNAKISFVTSQKIGCSIENILNEDPKSIWLSEDGLPQEIIIDLTSLSAYPTHIECIGIYCWHAYQTNPKLIEISISSNGTKYSSLGNFDLCLKPGTQLFDIDTHSINEIQYLKLTIKETFSGCRTYINNVIMYEKMPSDNEINTHNSLNESSLMMYVRESREKNMPFCIRDPGLLTSKLNNLKATFNNHQQLNAGVVVKANTNLISKDLADDLLDMKSKDKFNNLHLNTTENNTFMSDDDVSKKHYGINNSHSHSHIHNVNSNIIEEDEDKENAYSTSKKKKQHTTMLKREKEAIRYDEQENDNDNDNDNDNGVNHSNNNIHNECNSSIPKRLFQHTKHQEMMNPNLLSFNPSNNYMNYEESQQDEQHNKTVIDVSRLESEFREFKSRQEDKYKQVNNRMLNIEKELLHIKDEITKINQNINIILEEQNSQYNLILEECRNMINNKIVNVFCNANSMHQHVPSNQNNSMLFSLNNNNDDNNVINTNNNINISQNVSAKFKDEIDEQELLYPRQTDLLSMNEGIIIGSKESELDKMNELFANKFEEKLADFSSKLGKQISDSLLKPSFERIENLIKDNLNDVQNTFKMIGKKAKDNNPRNTVGYSTYRNNIPSSLHKHNSNTINISLNYRDKSTRNKVVDPFVNLIHDEQQQQQPQQQQVMRRNDNDNMDIYNYPLKYRTINKQSK